MLQHTRQFLGITMIVVILVVLCCGCGLYDKEYSIVENYPMTVNDSDKKSNSVHNYYELEEAVLDLVHQHLEEGTLKFENYEGDISNDLKNVCWELRTGDAFCAYCVNSLQYELDHIVSHEGAHITASYSRSAEEMEQIRMLSYSTDMAGYIEQTIDQLQDKLVVLINNSALDEEGVRELVETTYEDHPLIAIAAPVTSVRMYTGNGLQRLFDVEFSYGDSNESITEKKEQVRQIVAEIAQQTETDRTETTLLNLVENVNSRCHYQEDYIGNSVYSCLISREANSQGLALTFQSVCQELGIDCETIFGYYNRKDHWWNIVHIGDDYYHIDVSSCAAMGMETGFLKSDVEMWNEYRWDTSIYPECSGNLTYEKVINEQGAS